MSSTCCCFVSWILLLFLSCYCCSGSDNIIVFSDLQSTTSLLSAKAFKEGDDFFPCFKFVAAPYHGGAHKLGMIVG